MNQKLKKFKYITLGLAMGIILVSSTTVIADTTQKTIEVIMNNINININGTVLAKQNDVHTLPNGDKIPYSILYKGTTYLPMRVIAESIDKDVKWDSSTSTASINDKNISITNNNLVEITKTDIDEYNKFKTLIEYKDLVYDQRLDEYKLEVIFHNGHRKGIDWDNSTSVEIITKYSDECTEYLRTLSSPNAIATLLINELYVDKTKPLTIHIVHGFLGINMIGIKKIEDKIFYLYNNINDI